MTTNPMAAAWKAYRIARQCRWHARDTESRKVFLPTLFAACLRTAWDDVRKEQRAEQVRRIDRIAAQLNDKIRQSQVDLASRMPPAARADRIRTILTELSFAGSFSGSWSYDRALHREAELRRELAILQEVDERPSMPANIRTGGALAITLAQVAA